MVRDSGSKHENSRTSGRSSGELAGRSGSDIPSQLARNWFQLGGRDRWFHGESSCSAESMEISLIQSNKKFHFHQRRSI